MTASISAKVRNGSFSSSLGKRRPLAGKAPLSSPPWAALRGYHLLRHSFISALASEGVDQRVIDEVVGHQSEEQRKRYRHLYPTVVLGAVVRVFG